MTLTVHPAENGPWFIIRRNGNVVRGGTLLPLVFDTEAEAKRAMKEMGDE